MWAAAQLPHQRSIAAALGALKDQIFFYFWCFVVFKILGHGSLDHNTGRLEHTHRIQITVTPRTDGVFEQLFLFQFLVPVLVFQIRPTHLYQYILSSSPG